MFCDDADESDDVPTLSKGKSYTMYRLTAKEWKMAAMIREAMEVRSQCAYGVVITNTMIT